MDTSTRTDGAIVDWAFYRAGVRDTSVGSYREATALAKAGDGFVWIGLHEPTADEFASIAETFDLHPLAVEDTDQGLPAAQARALRRLGVRGAEDRRVRRS